MQTVIFDFKRKAVALSGTPGSERLYADLIATQRKIRATSPSTAPQPQLKPR
jgi:hypothetical protein